MFGSQVLETAIGLALMFFAIAFAASSIIEIYSRLLSKRAKDLESTVGAMLAGGGVPDAQINAALTAFKATSIYQSAHAAAGKSVFGTKIRPSYVSAKAFSDAVSEMLGGAGAIQTMPAGLRKRLEPLVRETGADLLAIKTGLERWFDETMGRLEGAYKRWAMLWLAIVGFVVAVAGNASTFDVAVKLWHDPVTREAVAEAAGRVTTVEQSPTGQSAPEEQSAADITSVADAVDELEELGLPVGWDDAAKQEWDDWASPWEWSGSQLGTLLGWLLTALLVMLGAPFWYEVLTKLASLRSTGTKPPSAPNDPGSNTSLAIESASVVGPPGPAAMAAPAPAPGANVFEANLRAALGLPQP
jgi:hypothetical protein